MKIIDKGQTVYPSLAPTVWIGSARLPKDFAVRATDTDNREFEPYEAGDTIPCRAAPQTPVRKSA